jgi:hypothetical protein
VATHLIFDGTAVFHNLCAAATTSSNYALDHKLDSIAWHDLTEKLAPWSGSQLQLSRAAGRRLICTICCCRYAADASSSAFKTSSNTSYSRAKCQLPMFATSLSVYSPQVYMIVETWYNVFTTSCQTLVCKLLLIPNY